MRETSTGRRVLFVTNTLRPNRGGDAVSAWIIQALHPLYDLTVLAWATPDWGALDRRFGTSLRQKRITILTPPRPLTWLLEQVPDDSDYQSAACLMRYAKKWGGGFDGLVAAGSMEWDLGRPCLQYVHSPVLHQKHHLLHHPGHRMRPWLVMSGFSLEQMRRNRTLTNSEYTRSKFQAAFNLDSRVVYPPVECARTEIPWEAREDGFVTIGIPERPKRQDWMLETLAQVRREVPGVQLHICGPRKSSAFAEHLQKMAAAEGPWIQFHFDLPSDALMDLVGRQRYGIHAMEGEPFGIAPASMARSGCLPFVHASGGQVETVNHEDALCYSTREDAVARILAVMRDFHLQRRLRDALLSSSARFSPEAFVSGVRTAMAEFLR